jgi:SAM-dependent methyltransferase
VSVQQLQARLYSDPLRADAVVRFMSELSGYVQPWHELLDLGAGGGHKNRYAFKGNVKKITGVDLDPRVVDNPLLDEGVEANITDLPFADSSFDVAFAIYVLEHLDDPQAFVREVRRVLRPGGYFLALTPNRFHYVPLVSSLTPTRFHKWYNRRRGRQEDDTFPTLYRMNSRRALMNQFISEGFEVERLQTIEVQPNYLKFSSLSFLLGTAYERVVNSSELWAALRVNIISVFRNGPKDS